MRTKLRSKISLLFMTCAVLLAIPAIALADTVANDLDNTVDTTLETMTLTQGGADGTTKIYVAPANGDGISGCNLKNTGEITVNASSGNTSVATVSPSSTTITDCDVANGKTITVTPQGPGSTTISVTGPSSIVNGSETGTFTYRADFTVNVKKATSISAVSGTGTSGSPGSADLTAKLSSGTDDMSGKTISFAVNPTAGVCDNNTADNTLPDCPTATAQTGSGGVANASVSLPSTFTAANSPYTITASYAGDATNYGASSGTGNLVVTPPCTAPSVTSHPSNQTVTYGGNASFTAAASGTSPSVQWQVSTGSGFTNISGENNATLSLTKPPVSASGNQYRAVFTNDCGTATSNAATLTVNQKALTITGLTAENKVFDGNNSATITGTPALDGVIDPDVVSLQGTASGTFDNALVGDNKLVTVSGFSLTGADSGNYRLNNPQLELHANILRWTLNGFFAPVDYDVGTTKVWNTVKGGATVPLKFEIFRGATESSNTADVDKFIFTGVACPATGYVADDIEITTTGGTQLRYDSTAGQFIQNWQTPKKAGSCYDVTMQTDDGSKLPVAHFVLK